LKLIKLIERKRIREKKTFLTTVKIYVGGLVYSKIEMNVEIFSPGEREEITKAANADAVSIFKL
jgi:hypothetical protein